MPQKRLFCVGFGFSAAHLAGLLLKEGWSVAGTCRSQEKKARLEKDGIEAFVFSPDEPLKAGALKGATHLLASAPPEAPLAWYPFRRNSRTSNRLRWASSSTTSTDFFT